MDLINNEQNEAPQYPITAISKKDKIGKKGEGEWNMKMEAVEWVEAMKKQ